MKRISEVSPHAFRQDKRKDERVLWMDKEGGEQDNEPGGGGSGPPTKKQGSGPPTKKQGSEPPTKMPGGPAAPEFNFF